MKKSLKRSQRFRLKPRKATYTIGLTNMITDNQHRDKRHFCKCQTCRADRSHRYAQARIVCDLLVSIGLLEIFAWTPTGGRLYCSPQRSFSLHGGSDQ